MKSKSLMVVYKRGRKAESLNYVTLDLPFNLNTTQWCQKCYCAVKAAEVNASSSSEIKFLY